MELEADDWPAPFYRPVASPRALGHEQDGTGGGVLEKGVVPVMLQCCGDDLERSADQAYSLRKGSVRAMKTLGERIRELREEKDISLRELATQIGVSAAFMSDVELGRRYPSDKHVQAVARVLETTLRDLRQFDTRPPVREFRQATMADPAYSFAFRRMLDKSVSSSELLEFIDEIDERRQGSNGDRE